MKLSLLTAVLSILASPAFADCLEQGDRVVADGKYGVVESALCSGADATYDYTVQFDDGSERDFFNSPEDGGALPTLVEAAAPDQSDPNLPDL